VRTEKAVAVGADRGNRGFGAQMTIAGGRPQQNNYRMDGISISDYSNGTPGCVSGINLGVDAIQEFSVVTANASADYGREAGGVINAVSRAGTNDFHGTVFDFLRNDIFDARNYFDGAKKGDLRKKPARRGARWPYLQGPYLLLRGLRRHPRSRGHSFHGKCAERQCSAGYLELSPGGRRHTGGRMSDSGSAGGRQHLYCARNS
jgi:hypothetical protein